MATPTSNEEATAVLTQYLKANPNASDEELSKVIQSCKKPE